MRHISLEEVTCREGPGPWWLAHDHPERAPDEFVVWSWDCDRCILHLIAAAEQCPGEVTHEVTEHGLTISTTDTTLAQARQWRAEQGLPPL